MDEKSNPTTFIISSNSIVVVDCIFITCMLQALSLRSVYLFNVMSY